jgi:hypothetical protein
MKDLDLAAPADGHLQVARRLPLEEGVPQVEVLDAHR